MFLHTQHAFFQRNFNPQYLNNFTNFKFTSNWFYLIDFIKGKILINQLQIYNVSFAIFKNIIEQRAYSKKSLSVGDLISEIVEIFPYISPTQFPSFALFLCWEFCTFYIRPKCSSFVLLSIQVTHTLINHPIAS